MSLWGNNDNLVSSGTVALNYDTGVVTGTGTTFGTAGFGEVGDVIRFGTRGAGVGLTYYGDAVIVSVASTISVTIGSTSGLTGGVISGAEYKLSQLPKSSVLDHSNSEKNTDYDKIVYGIGTDAFDDVSTAYRTSGTGWVGVQTYMDAQNNLRVKSEILVAMGTPHEDSTSGIQTGTGSILYPTNEHS